MRSLFAIVMMIICPYLIHICQASPLWPEPMNSILDSSINAHHPSVATVTQDEVANAKDQYKVEKVWHGEWPQEQMKFVPTGKIDSEAPSQSGLALLFKDEQTSIAGNSIRTRIKFIPSEDREQLANYVVGKLSVREADQAEQIAFFAKHLLDSSALVATDARFQLQKYDAERLGESHDQFPLVEMRQQLRGKKEGWAEKDFYAFVLSFSSQYADRRLFAELIDDYLLAKNPDVDAIPGLLSAYATSGSRYAISMFGKILYQCKSKVESCWGLFDAMEYLYGRDSGASLEATRTGLVRLLKKGLGKHQSVKIRCVELATEWRNQEVASAVVALYQQGTDSKLNQAVEGYCQKLEVAACQTVQTSPQQDINDAEGAEQSATDETEEIDKK